MNEPRSGHVDSLPTDRFSWHPDYQGKTTAEVAKAIEAELARDQRAYQLTLAAAEDHEQAALATVLELERKWGTFDLNWAETDPTVLAEKIAAFEHARDEARELFPFDDYRERDRPSAPLVGPGRRVPWSVPDWRILVLAAITLLLIYVVFN